MQRQAEELRQAELFVDVHKYVELDDNHLIRTKGNAPLTDVRSLLLRFLGNRRTEEALDRYARQHNIDLQAAQQADPQLIAFAERLLTGAIGASSAQLLLQSVLKQTQIGLPELVLMLEESQQVLELNKQLKFKSQQLEKAKAALLQANEQLLRAQQLKDEFLYTVTHELRTPLTSIRAFSELLYDDPDMPLEERQHFLDLMVQELERLSRLITTVLDLEKYEAGNQELDVAPLDLAQLVEQALAANKPLLQAQGLVSSFDVRPQRLWMQGDRDKLQQVLSNLLSNAIKFAHRRIQLSLYELEGQLRLKITDDGPGIPHELKEKIFDKFYQVRHSRQAKPLQGSGLGLAISQKIVQLHGGQIWVEDAQPQGSRFCLSFPALQAKPPLENL